MKTNLENSAKLHKEIFYEQTLFLAEKVDILNIFLPLYTYRYTRFPSVNISRYSQQCKLNSDTLVHQTFIIPKR